MPSVDTDGDWFNITDSATEFDQLDSMTFMLVWKWNSQSYWTAGIRKHNSGNGNNQLTGFLLIGKTLVLINQLAYGGVQVPTKAGLRELAA